MFGIRIVSTSDIPFQEELYKKNFYLIWWKTFFFKNVCIIFLVRIFVDNDKQTIQKCLSHNLPCLQNIPSVKLCYFSSTTIHNFVKGSNLTKTMGFEIYDHGDIGVWKKFKPLIVVGWHYFLTSLAMVYMFLVMIFEVFQCSMMFLIVFSKAPHHVFLSSSPYSCVPCLVL